MDSLDDDLDLNYTPSIIGNSRSGSMKKLARKNDKSPSQPQKKPVTKPKNDFDQLDDLLMGEVKPKKKPQTKKMNDTIDSFFDEPNTTLNTTTKIGQKNLSLSPKKANNDLIRTSINYKPKHNQDQIINQDQISSYIKQTPTTNQINLPLDQKQKQGPIISSSMRNMKPPLRRRQSNSRQHNEGLSLMLQQSKDLKKEKQKDVLNQSNFNNVSLNLNSFANDISEIKPPSRSMSRRGSMDNKSEKRNDTSAGFGLTLNDQIKRQNTQVSHFHLIDRNQVSGLRIQSPSNKKKQSTMSELKIGQSILINEKNLHSNFYNQSKKQPQTLKHLGDHVNTSYQQHPHISFKISEQASNKQLQIQAKNHQQQIQHIKRTFESQVKYLQQNLDRQLKINQETRQKLIRESNDMIQNQRRRMTKVHDEEIKRVREMADWEKKKMEDTYKYEILGLKNTIQSYNKNNNSVSNSYEPFQTNKYKRQAEELESHLRSQRQLLADRQKMLTKRQLQLEEREQQFNKAKRREDDRIRQLQKKIMEMENASRNNILNERKNISDQKQKIGMEAANMELDLIRKKQKLQIISKEVQMEKQCLEKERHEIRLMNQQLMSRYKQKMDEVAVQKQRVSEKQAQLVRNLRIIELKAKQSSIPLDSVKQNNWVANERASSLSKTPQFYHPNSQSNLNITSKLNQTHQRFEKVEKNAKSNINIKSSTENMSGSDFKLQKFLMDMNKYGKTRQNNFM